MPHLLPLRPFPPLHWWRAALRPESQLDLEEVYPKRTFRNRMTLATANGPARLTLPVKRRGGTPRSQFHTERILEEAPKLWRAIRTAYAATPYFEEFEPELSRLFLHGPDTLGAWNLASVEWAAGWLGMEVPPPADGTERSSGTHEERDAEWRGLSDSDVAPWPHIWKDRSGLSWGALPILDLLLHCGPEAARWVTPLPPSGSERPG